MSDVRDLRKLSDSGWRQKRPKKSNVGWRQTKKSDKDYSKNRMSLKRCDSMRANVRKCSRKRLMRRGKLKRMRRKKGSSLPRLTKPTEPNTKLKKPLVRSLHKRNRSEFDLKKRPTS